MTSLFNFLAFDPSGYTLAIDLFVRLLGFIYVVAYVPFLFQIKGLLGRDGILPVTEYFAFIKNRLGWKGLYLRPSIFWFHSSDIALLLLIFLGITLGALLMLGFYPALVLLLLYFIHLSLTNAGQDFLSFGWETLLMEVTIATSITVATVPYNIFGWISLNFLLLRFHFQAGASKLMSGDKNWRNLTALSYHYVTQPLPNTTAWYFDKLPMGFHKFCAVVTFYAELLVPLFIFSPPEVRLFVFTQLVGLQISIWLTGNLAYLNHLTVVMCIILLHNKFLEPFLDTAQALVPISSILWQGTISILGALFLSLQLMTLWHTFFPKTLFNHIIEFFLPFHIAYPHGLFAVMTTKRYEIILEGSEDGETWKEFIFYFKPGPLSWRPRRVAPYQPRLDWQAWFLPFGRYRNEVWFNRFIIKLLQGSPSVLKLIRHNPFEKRPPLYIRSLVYDYQFTTVEEKKQSGNWWKRTLIGEYSPPMTLR